MLMDLQDAALRSPWTRSWYVIGDGLLTEFEIKFNFLVIMSGRKQRCLNLRGFQFKITVRQPAV